MQGVGGPDLTTPLLLAAILGVALLFVLVILVAVVGVLYLRGGSADPGAGRREGLISLGYAELKEGSWTRPIQGTQMVFDERPTGHRWSLQLPRYNTMTLDLVEKTSGQEVTAPFQSGISDLDGRFALGSLQPAHILTLLGESKLQRAMTRIPNLSLQLSADELVIEDPGNTGLATLAGTKVEAELAMHQLVANLVNTLFGVLYTEAGTVFEQFR